MDEAMLTAMMDPRFGPLSELLYLVDTSKVNRLRVLGAIRDVTAGPT